MSAARAAWLIVRLCCCRTVRRRSPIWRKEAARLSFAKPFCAAVEADLAAFRPVPLTRRPMLTPHLSLSDSIFDEASLGTCGCGTHALVLQRHGCDLRVLAEADTLRIAVTQVALERLVRLRVQRYDLRRTSDDTGRSVGPPRTSVAAIHVDTHNAVGFGDGLSGAHRCTFRASRLQARKAPTSTGRRVDHHTKPGN